MENFMMINGIFNRIGISNNYLRLMACKMLCMCFIISTLAFAQRSSVINNTSARNNHLESGIVLPAPIGDLNGNDASRTACFSHGMTNSNWITGFWGPDSGSTEPPTFAALHSFNPGPMELEEAIIHGYYSTDDTTTARAQVFIGVADINGTTIETIASDIIYFNIGEEGPWTTASIDLSGATYYSTDSTFLKIVWSPLDDGYSSLFGANMWIPGQRIDDPNIYAPNGLSGWDSAGVYFPSDWYNYVIEICGTPSNITMAGIEIEEVEAYPGDDVQVGIFFEGQGQLGGTFTGEYYNGSTGGSPDFGELVLVREDFEINFDWGDGSPDPLVQNNGFQVRWTGTIYAEETGTYYFRSYTDDGLRLFIDEQPVIDEWWDFPATNHYGQIELDPGLHDLEMEYYESGGGAVALLYWIPPNGVETLVEPSDHVALNSAEFQFDGFQDFDVDFTGITLEGTQLGDLDWAVEFNNTDSMLYVALAGADGINIADLNTLFWLEFHVHDDAMLGDIPIDFAGGILNTESPYWEVEPGGIWVMDPNNPPGVFDLLTPSDGFTLSITQDNINASTAFTWGESVDPDGDEIEYLLVYLPFFDLPDGGTEDVGLLINYNYGSTNFHLAHQDVVDAMSELQSVTGNVYWNVLASDGMWVPSLDFGYGSYVEVPNSTDLNFGDSPLGISLWFKFYADPDTTQPFQQSQELISKFDLGGSNGYELQINMLDHYSGFLTAYVGDQPFSSDMILMDDHLYHAVVTRDVNGHYTMYINGVVVGEMSSNFDEIENASSNSNLFLGIDPYYGEEFSGSMTDVCLYQEWLSPEYVSTLYGDGNGMHSNSPTEYGVVGAYWPMDTQDSILVDNVHNNHGEIYDATWAALATGREIWGGNGPFQFAIDLTLLSVIESSVPVTYSLHQNYPNPFNPITTIRYDLPEAGHVNVVIYDMMGRQIKQLISGTEDAGRKSVVWDSTNDYGKPVSAGVYMYRIQTGEYIQTKKMVLLK